MCHWQIVYAASLEFTLANGKDTQINVSHTSRIQNDIRGVFTKSRLPSLCDFPGRITKGRCTQFVGDRCALISVRLHYSKHWGNGVHCIDGNSVAIQCSETRACHSGNCYIMSASVPYGDVAKWSCWWIKLVILFNSDRTTPIQRENLGGRLCKTLLVLNTLLFRVIQNTWKR